MKVLKPGDLVKIDNATTKLGLVISIESKGVLEWAVILDSAGECRLISLEYLEVLK